MRTLLLYTLVATLPTNVQGQLGNRDWLDRIRDIIKDNIRPDDDEMQTLTPEAEVFGSDAPSWVPTLSPTISSTLGPSAAPSAVPSDTPSDVPSDSPSDVSSDVPSDIPSYLPSDFPSYLPSDMPSNTPSMEPPTISVSPSPSKSPTGKIRRTAAPTPTFPDAVLESSLPEGFVPCRHGDSILEDTTGMRVLYLYRLRLEPNVELELATSIIESILSEAIQDTTCQNMVQVHAISTNPADTAVGEPLCFD